MKNFMKFRRIQSKPLIKRGAPKVLIAPVETIAKPTSGSKLESGGKSAKPGKPTRNQDPGAKPQRGRS